MRESMAQLTPRFSANRAVCDYAEKHYIPAASAYRARAGDKGATGKQVVDWQQALEERWGMLRLGEVTVKTDGEHHKFEAQLFTGDLDPSSVRVELYADGINGGARGSAGDGARASTGNGWPCLLYTSGSRTPIYRLHGASDTAFQRCCGSTGSRSDSMAAPMTKTPERPLHAYLKAVSDCKGVRVGSALPLGTSQQDSGGNFAFFSRHATRARLELFDSPDDRTPSRQIDLDPARNRTGDVWHVWVDGIRPGQLYAYRVDGPYLPSEGQRFNFAMLLLDPFATAVSPLARWDFAKALGYDPSAPGQDLVCSKVDDAAAMPKCVFTHEHFKWDGDQPPRHPWSQMVIYEAHIRGFTFDSSSGVQNPGTYRGLVEKLPYLKDLGVTSVELMPVLEFNENPGTRRAFADWRATRGLLGIQSRGFLCAQSLLQQFGRYGAAEARIQRDGSGVPRRGYRSDSGCRFQSHRRRKRAGADSVFPGMDNAIFYTLAGDKRYYRDFTGTGNTINANHPVIRDHILAALRYWVVEMHVDGFRFDLASVLGRDESGQLLADAPLLERIAEDPILRDVKLIAEAWDAAGAYQVGSFSKKRWAEWNGRYRDDVRRFWRGDDGMLGAFASRLCGSADIYAHSGRGPESSINFITCHDGFTLNDLVSYRYKHNQANGENNHDGGNR